MLSRVALSVAVHLLGALLGVGLIWLLMRSDSSLATSLIERMINSPGALQRVREEAMGHVWLWCAVSVSAAFVLSTIWIVLAERASPVDDREARSMTASWAGMFIFTIAAFAAIGYLQIVGSGISAFVNAKAIAIGGIACLVITCVAYYVGTLIGVKKTMRPSVPFAPSF